MSGRMDYYYHYTTKEGVDAILNSGVIRASRRHRGYYNGDAVFGDGVYLTRKDPHTFTKQQLAQNNYDSMVYTWKTLLKSGKLDYAIVLKMPAYSVREAPCTYRDIYISDYDIYLNSVEYQVVCVPN